MKELVKLKYYYCTTHLGMYGRRELGILDDRMMQLSLQCYRHSCSVTLRRVRQEGQFQIV